MKKIIIATMIVANALFCSAQEFMGIKVDGSPSEITAAFQKKGFKVKKTDGNIITMTGKMNETEIELMALFTPKSKKCWKFAIFLPEETTWGRIKGEYEDYLAVLTEKYGQPSKIYDTFLKPYYEGDGYEMSAIRLEKCVYSSFWMELGISIAITKYAQVKICYENPINSDLDTQEQNELKKNTL